MKLGLLDSWSAVARQNPNPNLLRLLVMRMRLDLVGQEQMARPVPPFLQSLLLEPGFLVLRSGSATTESVLAVSSDGESSDETGPPWSRASGTWRTAEVAAGAKSVAEAQTLGGAKDRATTAATAAVPTGVKFVVGGARPCGFEQNRATTTSEFAEYSGELPVEVGGARLPGLAKYSTDAPTVVKSVGMGEARPPGSRCTLRRYPTPNW